VYKLNEFFVVMILLYLFFGTLSILILHSKKKSDWYHLGISGETSDHFFALEVELLPGKE